MTVSLNLNPFYNNPYLQNTYPNGEPPEPTEPTDAPSTNNPPSAVVITISPEAIAAQQNSTVAADGEAVAAPATETAVQANARQFSNLPLTQAPDSTVVTVTGTRPAISGDVSALD